MYYIATYTHHNGSKASMVKISCADDFVSRNDEFRAFARDVAMQVVALDSAGEAPFLKTPFIKDPETSMQELLDAQREKFGDSSISIVSLVYASQEGVEFETVLESDR